jgi:hypothetical protein
LFIENRRAGGNPAIGIAASEIIGYQADICGIGRK